MATMVFRLTMKSTKVKINKNDHRAGLQPSAPVEEHQYFPTKDGYVINVLARTARVPPARTAVLDKDH